jgi:exopolyphosphatase/guanosine-5'-triphosphate,3'-diphosphate pyrophosphatase
MGCDCALPDISMRLASIDIGTNTILLLIADISDNGTLTVVRDEHFIARLGKGVDQNGLIQQETFVRVHNILHRLKSIADSENVENTVACGTSALRDAKNRTEFMEFINRQLSVKIKVLSGSEEAKLTYIGAVSDYIRSMPAEEFAVLDIGGGSTELVMGTGLNIITANSIDIGSVRLTERILKTSPPDANALQKAVMLVQEKFQSIPSVSPKTSVIGVAGTLTTLASLDLAITKFDRNIINRHILSKDAIEKIFQELRPLTLDQIKSYPQIHPERADILLAGIIILLEILNKLNVNHIIVSNGGLRYGLLIDYANSLARNQTHLN